MSGNEIIISFNNPTFIIGLLNFFKDVINKLGKTGELLMKFDIIKTVNFITRDSAGQLYGFEKRPTMIHIAENNHYWAPKKGGYMIFIRERNDSLSFIEVSDKEPWIVDIIEDCNDKSVIELINGDEIYKIERKYGVVSVSREERIDVINDEPIFTSSQSIEVSKSKIRKFIDRIIDRIKS